MFFIFAKAKITTAINACKRSRTGGFAEKDCKRKGLFHMMADGEIFRIRIQEKGKENGKTF